MDIKLLDELERLAGVPHASRVYVGCDELRALIAAAREGVRLRKVAEKQEARARQWRSEAMAARGLLHDSGLHIYGWHTGEHGEKMDRAAHEYANERAANPTQEPTP